ncbi:hypothetical protein KP509_38G054600 [Ceratopteris richardii]|uniref:Very-long-chain (3R)-3-hydroxyacyl-CoA dehydratase n=1 Tax=Ceratopteris richardii TaxID=49495 RepID=A0A8T2Q521_CERRI|nr:hypothetical protein KP509_38G054600 [Ceratopteris richardii]
MQTLRTSSYEAIHAAVERPLQFAQTAAILEIFHGMLGLVRSPVSATLPQTGSRIYVTWAILWSFPETRTNPIVCHSRDFSWHIWYSTFYVLYPTGISSEVGLILTALPYVKVSEKYCLRMPNSYIPGSPYMYTYMIGLRAKALAKAKKSA